MGEITSWNVGPLNKKVMKEGMIRLKKAGEVVAKKARLRVRVAKKGRPVYKTGRYAGQFWTARIPGAMKKSIRVVAKHGSEAGGYITIKAGQLNIRIYAGTDFAYYAQILEFYHPFMRPALEDSKASILRILKNG